MKILGKSMVAFGVLQLVTGSWAWAGTVTEWPSKISNVVTPMGIAMAGVGFGIVGIANSSMVASEWARGKEKLAFRGALFSIGGTAIVNLMLSVFR